MHYKPVMDFFDLPAVNGARWGGGLLNNSAGTNPLSHDWNKVLATLACALIFTFQHRL